MGQLKQKTLCLVCQAVNTQSDPECGHRDAQTPLPDESYDANGEELLGEDDEQSFDLDLTFLDTPEAGQVAISGDNAAQAPVDLEAELARLLAPYSDASLTKARKLLVNTAVVLEKSEGQSSWYSVRGSTLYMVKITKGEDFLFAECSCPNGQHRGGDAICYHSIAARALHLALKETWVGA